MTDESDKKDEKDSKEPTSLVPLRSDGKVDVEQRISFDLYAYADQIAPETALAAYDADFYKAELARDTEGMPWRPHTLKINHQAGTFNFSDLGLKDYSPSIIKVQIMAHSPNRALWRVDQSEDDQRPLCSSTDAVHGSVVGPTGEPIRCAKCAFGQWWEPASLLNLVQARGKDSVFGRTASYIDAALKKRNVADSIAEFAVKRPNTNIPPPCKESRRIFALLYDWQRKGFSSQPVVYLIPPTSILLWDKFRQDLSLRTHYVRGEPIPSTLLTSVISVSLVTETRGPQTFSLFKFEFDRVAAPQATEYCKQVRDDWQDAVMSFQIQMSEFESDSAEDPTKIAGPPATQEEIDAVELPKTLEIDDAGDSII